MSFNSRKMRRQCHAHMLFNNSKFRLFMVSCLLIGVSTSILYCYGPSSWKAELQRKPQQLTAWLQRPESSSSPADAGSESLKKPDTKIDDTQAHGEETMPLIAWMESTGFTSKRVPLITIADSKYVRALRNLKARLDQWDRGSDLVVICLDLACAEEDSFGGYGGYVNGSGKTGDNVALIKFEVNLELAQNGYNFVFLDGDVYLTGSRDPFEDMLPLSDDTWDIQFQYDEKNNPTGKVNIGWYFARPTPATIEFFDRSYKNWTAHPAWDQWVMNVIMSVMESEEQSLRVHRLWNPRFQNWMCVDWQSLLFENENTTAAFIKDASIIHFTCVEQSLKTYFGLNYGGFNDIDEYYSSPPPLLAVANISGLTQSIHAQVAFAAQLANATGRTLIWPDSVSLVQKRAKTTKSPVEYEHVPKFPGVRAISYASAQQAGLKTVEGRYLSNQQAQIKADPLQEVLIDASKLVSEGGPSALESHVSRVKPTNVVVVDFANFAHGKWLRKFLESGSDPKSTSKTLAHFSADAEKTFQESYTETGMREYSAPMLQKIEECANANDRRSRCLRICNKA